MLRFDPFADLDRMSRQVERPTRSSVLAMDAIRDDDEVVIYFDVPGVSRDDIEVNVEKNELTVRVERRWDDSGQQKLAQERAQGTFTRSLMLGDALDLDQLTADLDEGVLTVKVPVSETSKQRTIQVGGGSSSSEAIDATSSD
ncbi:Hsp20/alpha crystallin family protein [Ilumatobacter sp.]|uniref:Hsp20/alpha crystallin family protein n=1 Tax=Ilumatobacter sp. TaxID=1967498 RepID=UPI003B518F75